MKLELIMLLYGLLRKILSRVVYKKDICTPHMHNVVQNYEMTINRGTSMAFFINEKFLNTPLPNPLKTSNLP